MAQITSPLTGAQLRDENKRLQSRVAELEQKRNVQIHVNDQLIKKWQHELGMAHVSPDRETLLTWFYDRIMRLESRLAGLLAGQDNTCDYIQAQGEWDEFQQWLVDTGRMSLSEVREAGGNVEERAK